MVKYGDTTLIEGTDYTLSGTLSATKSGNYEIKVSGTGNYYGEKYVYFSITPKDYDLDGDGILTAVDLVYEKKCILDSKSVAEDIYKRADVNEDEKVNVFDLTRLKQAFLKKISS